jgi:hypothetical protein
MYKSLYYILFLRGLYEKNELNIGIMIVAIILMGIFIPKMFHPAPVETVKGFIKASKDVNIKQMNKYLDKNIQ